MGFIFLKKWIHEQRNTNFFLKPNEIYWFCLPRSYSAYGIGYKTFKTRIGSRVFGFRSLHLFYCTHTHKNIYQKMQLTNADLFLLLRAFSRKHTIKPYLFSGMRDSLLGKMSSPYSRKHNVKKLKLGTKWKAVNAPTGAKWFLQEGKWLLSRKYISALH